MDFCLGMPFSCWPGTNRKLGGLCFDRSPFARFPSDFRVSVWKAWCKHVKGTPKLEIFRLAHRNQELPVVMTPKIENQQPLCQEGGKRGIWKHSPGKKTKNKQKHSNTSNSAAFLVQTSHPKSGDFLYRRSFRLKPLAGAADADARAGGLGAAGGRVVGAAGLGHGLLRWTARYGGWVRNP